SDAASLDVLHGPHFERRWRDEGWEGYEPPLDPRALVFFRGPHLANLGFHSALAGHHEHAALVGSALEREVQRARAPGHDGQARVANGPRPPSAPAPRRPRPAARARPPGAYSCAARGRTGDRR